MQLYELQKLGAESREFQTVGRNKLEEVDGMENDVTSKFNIEYIVMETPRLYYAETYLKKTEEMPQDLSVKQRSVAVQTETNNKDELEKIIERLSQSQLKYFFDILLKLVSKENIESYADKHEQILNVLKQDLSPKMPTEWTPLEPEPSPSTTFQFPPPGLYCPLPISPALNTAGRIKTSPQHITDRNKPNSDLNMCYEENSYKPNTSFPATSLTENQQIHSDCAMFETTEDKRVAKEADNSITPGQMSKDKRMVLNMKIPLTIEDIIHTSMEVFNDLVCKQDVTEEQMNICRDIRRRGKNKIAAQNCRKRKICQISHLESQLVQARSRKEKILSERVKLLWGQQEMRRRLDRLERAILDKMGKDGNMWMISVDSDMGARLREKMTA